jgi:hypothetical protein
MGQVQPTRVRALAVAGLFVVMAVWPSTAVGLAGPKSDLRADLDGQAIELAKVGDYYCHDFDYPAIHCFSDAKNLESSLSATLAATAVTYVVIYEFGTYQGAYMYVSQDYSILGYIGWNDRISSFRGVNSQAGVFWTDWLYTGTRYAFCCNVQVPSLGGYDNTFSSVFRN